MKNYFEYQNYIGTVHYSNEDAVFYGNVQGINDVVLFEGNSVSQLKTNFEEAIDDYKSTCKELGKTPEKTYKGVFNVRVSSSIHKKIAEIAFKKGMKLNELVVKTFDYLVAHEKQILK